MTTRHDTAIHEIPYTSHIDPDGTLRGELPEATPDPASVIPLYRAMVRARTFDARAIALHRTGRLGTYSSCLGQEAVGVGMAYAMAVDDVFVPSYREQAGQLVRGVTPVELGEHGVQAAGVALAFKTRREPRVAVCAMGDGASSKGAFYEAINAAGAMRLPLVTVIVNNGWAISAPTSVQSAATTLAHKALAAGIPGEQVDGNDVVAMTDVCSRAIERARAGDGPTLIEAVTYRLSDHTTVDDARRYRDDDEVSAHWRREPIGRIRDFLAAAGVWAKADEEELRAECSAEIDRAAEEFLAIPGQPTEAMFDHVWAEMPPDVARQRIQATLDWGKDG